MYFPQETEFYEETFPEVRSSSYQRFHMRIAIFKDQGRRFPRLQHAFWWLFHNCVAHMAIGLVPIRASFELHDWTSRKLGGE